MEKENLRKKAKELIKKRGNALGEIFLSNKLYIIEKEGDVGIKIVEEEIRDLVDINFKFDRINKFSWYPQALNVLIILICKETFKWNNENIFNMGGNAAKFSFISKSLLHLISAEEMFKRSSDYWKRYYDSSELIPVGFDRQEKYLVLRVEKFKYDPVLCLYTKGYFLSIFKDFMKVNNVIIKETQCSFLGDPYEEYKIKWI
jgi:hypothetical protein